MLEYIFIYYFLW